MRYLVRARVKSGREADLLRAIENETLGQGSVAEGEYLRNMNDAQLTEDGTVRWVEISAIVRLRFRKSVLTGRSTSISRKCRMRTTAANAATRTARNLGPAATAIARRAWSRN